MAELILRNIPAGVLDKLGLGEEDRERLRRLLAGIRVRPDAPKPVFRPEAHPGTGTTTGAKIDRRGRA